MVKLEDIDSIFSNIIRGSFVEDEKCGQRLRLQNSLSETMDNFTGLVRGQSKEVAVFLSDEGELLGTLEGDEDSVDLPKNFLKEMFQKNKVQPFNVDHNHPNPYASLFPVCLSYDDLERITDYDKKYGFLCKSISVEDGFNNSRMSLVRGDAFTKSDAGTFKTIAHSFERDAMRMTEKFNEKRSEIFHSLFDGSSLGNLNEIDMAFVNYYIHSFTSKKALEEIGFNDFIGDYKKKFRDVNCSLNYEVTDIVDNDKEFINMMADVLAESDIEL